jgi:hypothetical protein
VADLGFWKGGAIFSQVKAMIGKNHFLRTVRGGKNSISFAFAGKNRKFFLEGRGDRPHRPPLNPPPIIQNIIFFIYFEVFLYLIRVTIKIQYPSR